MNSRLLGYFFASVVLVAVSACNVLKSGVIPASGSPSTPSSAETTRNVSPQETRPRTKLGRMSIGSSTTEVELKLFEDETLPFFTYIPAKDFVEEAIDTPQGKGARFYVVANNTKNENAYLEIVSPKNVSDTAQVQDLILRKDGLLVQNNWQIVDRTEVISYPWAKEKIDYQQQTATATYTGSIFVGDQDGEMFYVVTHYPTEYSSDFEPRAILILENLSFER